VPSPRASLRVRWNGSRCTLDLDLPAPGERPAELGVRTCEVQP
jgi:hypothetical protein